MSSCSDYDRQNQANRIHKVKHRATRLEELHIKSGTPATIPLDIKRSPPVDFKGY